MDNLSDFRNLPKLKRTWAAFAMAVIALILAFVFYELNLSLIPYFSGGNALNDSIAGMLRTWLIVLCAMQVDSLASFILAILALRKRDRSWAAYTGLIIGIPVFAYATFVLYAVIPGTGA